MNTIPHVKESDQVSDAIVLTRPEQDPELPVIYTSRYANHVIAQSGLTAVGITLGNPRMKLEYQLVEHDRRFAPTRAMFDVTDKGVFRPLMYDRLSKMGRSALDILRRYDDLHGSKGLVLLCFEDVRLPDEWCHRQIVAEWLGQMFGLVVEELPHVEGDEPKGATVEHKPSGEKSKARRKGGKKLPDAPLLEGLSAFGSGFDEPAQGSMFGETLVPDEPVDRVFQNFG